MSLLGSILPGLLNSLNPANLIRGAVNTAVGVLENISKGNPVDISGNLSRGLKTAFAQDQNAIGSIGGQNIIEPSSGDKLAGRDNAANIESARRMSAISGELQPSINRNAANLRGVYSENRTRGGLANPVMEKVAVPSMETSPAGLPDKRIKIVNAPANKFRKTDLLNARDSYGYKTISGAPFSPPVGTKMGGKIQMPRAPRFRRKKVRQ